MWGEVSLTFTSNGEIKKFYCDSVCYGLKVLLEQPLPKGWHITIKVEAD